MRYYKIATIAILILGMAVIVVAQFSTPTLFDADGYLHIRMAKFLRQYGLIDNFHWARYSVFNTHFSDKDFLYHVLLVPFTYFSNIFLGIKVATCIFSCFLFGALFFMLKKYCRVKLLIPVFLAALFLSGGFLQALCRARNMVFVIGIFLLFVHFLIQRRQWPLFIVTVAYVLGHVTGPLLIGFALIGEVTRLFSGEGFYWKNLRTVGLGVLAGMLAHPNFPNNFLFFYLNSVLVPVFALKWGLELGAEFFPLDTRQFVLEYPLILLGVLLLIAAAASRPKDIRVSTKIWLAEAGFFYFFSFFSQRYLVHAYPLVLVGLAAYFSDWFSGEKRFLRLRRRRILKALAISGAAAIFLLLGWFAYKSFQKHTRVEQVYNTHYENFGKWMSANIPPGEVIFHANWSDSQYFIGLNPQDDYFVTLDPIYMYYWNPGKYNLYRQIAFGNNPDPHAALKREFGVRYGYANKNYFSGLINQVRYDTRFQILREDPYGVVFRVW